MRHKLLVWLVVITLLLGGYQIAAAAPPPPTIILFASSLQEVSLADLEAGTATTTFTWYTVGLTAEHRLTLHYYLQNHWEPVFDAASVPLEPYGSREVTLQQPLNFGSPTYLLSIVDAQSRIVEQRVLVIPFAETPGVEPVIESLTADQTSLDAAAVASGAALVVLTWDVSGRLPNSNLVFEQVFSDGSSVSVELPRSVLWVSSAGSGPVLPVYREGETQITLRLSVADLVTTNVYVAEEITLALTGASPVVPLPATVPAVTIVAPTPVASAGGTQVISFTASPDTVTPGAAVTLTWAVPGTAGVTIDQTVPGMDLVQTVVSAQSPEGTATVYLPDYAAYSVTYTLWTAARDTSAQAVVQVHCPYTFFFGAGDGCPSGEAREVQAAYEAFEGGFMVWHGDTQEIYVFYREPGMTSGEAAYYLESNFAGMPESQGDETPPLDRYAPVSGFGRIWTNAPGVKDRLGWAMETEHGYAMTVQQVATTRDPRPEFTLYLTLPDERVIGSGFGRWRSIE